MHYCTLWNSALINTTVSIHPECVSRGWLINKTEAPAAHNPCMVNGAEVKTSLYAKIHKLPEGPQTSHWGARAWVLLSVPLDTGEPQASLSVTLASERAPGETLLQGACQTLFFLPLDSATEKAWATWKIPWSARTPQFWVVLKATLQNNIRAGHGDF